MNNIFHAVLDKKSSAPLYVQLGDEIRRLIESGDLAKNEKLPPIRQLSETLKISAATVVAAYKYLENKSLAYSRVGSGTFVSPFPIEQIPSPIKINIGKGFNDGGAIKNGINFLNSSLPSELFPADDFKNAFNKLLDEQKGAAFEATDESGYFPLRESVCKYLLRYNIKTTPQNTQILTGAQQGIDLVSKAIISLGDVVFVESPTFYGAMAAFSSRGGKIIEIPMQSDGIDTAALENFAKLYKPKFLYAMTYFQTPTGVSYSPEKKRALLELAEKYDFYIIEDDNLYDFNYSDEAVTPLKALDYKNRVVYIKSFSKILMPGLRIGFAVLPKKLIMAMKSAKYASDISTSGFTQKALNIYLNSDNYKKHLSKITAYAKSKYQTAISASELYIGKDFPFIKPCGGISLWIDVGGFKSSLEIASDLALEGVFVAPEEQFLPQNAVGGHIRLCFASLSREEIYAGIKIIGNYLKNYSKT